MDEAVGTRTAARTAPTVEDHRSKPRKRGETLVNAIYEAARAELAEHGYAGLSMDRIATRAHTSKAALYRRWPTCADLVVDAVRAAGIGDQDPPATGDLREDLLATLRAGAKRFSGPHSGLARALLTETLRDPELTEAARANVIRAHWQRILRILQYAADRGEVRPEAATSRVASVGPALVASHFIVHGGPVPDQVIAEIVDDVLLPLLRPCPPTASLRPDA